MLKPNYVAAHRHSIRHYAELEQSKICGCFHCLRTFSFAEITDWIADGDTPEDRTALCPFCGIDSVIGSASGYLITSEFLQNMNRYWF